MKSYQLLWIFFCVALVGCTGTQSDHFILNGIIEDTEEVSVVYMQQFRNKMYFVVDSAEVINGRFTFQGEVGNPSLYAFSLDKKRSSSFFVESGAYDVVYNPRKLLVRVKNSEANQLYSDYLPLAQEGVLNIDSLIRVYPKSEVPLYLLYRYYSYNTTPEKLRNSQNRIDSTLSNRYFNVQINTIIEHLEQVEVGREASDFILPDTLGNEVALSSFRGKYVLLEFWASWCPYCRRQSPVLVDVFKQFSSKDFTIFSVSLEHNREAWLKAIYHDHLDNWQHVSELTMWDSKIAELYAVRAIPSNFLIDPDGMILAKNLENEALTVALNHLFNE